jgi:hypothetical protein
MPAWARRDHGEILPPLLEPHLAGDLRVDDRRSDRLRLGAAAVAAAGAGRSVRRRAEEYVLHRPAAARGARELGEDR